MGGSSSRLNLSPLTEQQKDLFKEFIQNHCTIDPLAQCKFGDLKRHLVVFLTIRGTRELQGVSPAFLSMHMMYTYLNDLLEPDYRIELYMKGSVPSLTHYPGSLLRGIKVHSGVSNEEWKEFVTRDYIPSIHSQHLREFLTERCVFDVETTTDYNNFVNAYAKFLFARIGRSLKRKHIKRYAQQTARNYLDPSGGSYLYGIGIIRDSYFDTVQKLGISVPPKSTVDLCTVRSTDGKMLESVAVERPDTPRIQQ